MPSWLFPYPDPVWGCFCNFPVSLVGKVQRDSVFLSGFLSRQSSFLSAAPLPHLSLGNWYLSSFLHHQKRFIPEGYPESRYVYVPGTGWHLHKAVQKARQLPGFGVSLPMPPTPSLHPTPPPHPNCGVRLSEDCKGRSRERELPQLEEH